MIRSRRTTLGIAAVLTGVLAMMIPATPATAGANQSPPPRESPQMAYDAADGQLVVFGGLRNTHPHTQVYLSDTWTWDGSRWTKQHPTHSPPARAFGGMAYDAALGEVVLFGGEEQIGRLGDTWTWDGSDWTQQHPTHSPLPRSTFGIAYDAMRAQVVVFGGADATDNFLDTTWTWDGTDWTERSPAHMPGRRVSPAMTYDPVDGVVMLFGGFVCCFTADNDTWTWDGTDWTLSTSQHRPPGRIAAAMASDDASGRVILFGGGDGNNHVLGDTWSWNGTDWNELHPAVSPASRAYHAMADDAAVGRVVLFGGHRKRQFGDTWTLDGDTWAQAPAGAFDVTPSSGPPGASVRIKGWGFAPSETVKVFWVDSRFGVVFLTKTVAGAGGGFTIRVTVPGGATPGAQHIKVKQHATGQSVKDRFTVT